MELPKQILWGLYVSNLISSVDIFPFESFKILAKWLFFSTFYSEMASEKFFFKQKQFYHFFCFYQLIQFVCRRGSTRVPKNLTNSMDFSSNLRFTKVTIATIKWCRIANWVRIFGDCIWMNIFHQKSILFLHQMDPFSFHSVSIKAF